MNITAKADYAVRAVTVLALAPAGSPVKSESIARAQNIPRKFLDNILAELRTAGLIRTVRGAEGGSMLARPAETISVAEVLRAVEGPLAAVRGMRPDQLVYEGSAKALSDVWFAVRASLRGVLEHVSVAQLAADELPEHVRALAADPDARSPH